MTESIFQEEASTTRTLRNIKNNLKKSIEEYYPNSSECATEELLNIHGLNKESFDFIAKTEEFLKNSLNDISIDDNSNKSEKAISATISEMISPVAKAVGYDYLYREMVAEYGKKEAKRLSGEMYSYALAISDSTKILVPYCWAMDATKLVTGGRPFGQLHSLPPKRISSYIAALNETVHQLSSHLAGAIAVGSFMLDVAHLGILKEKITLEQLKEDGYRKYIENCFQNFVHSVNHLSRNGIESPFVNISLFDEPKIKAFYKDMDWYFNPAFNGSDVETPTEEYIIAYVKELQDIFLDFFDKGDPSHDGMPIRFPVLTLNLSKDDNDKIIDKEFFKSVTKREIYRYNIFASSGSKVASCCFKGSEKVLARNENGLPKIDTFENWYNLPQKTKFRIPNAGGWEYGKIVKLDGQNKKMYEVTTSNKKSIIVTEDHINPTYRGDIPSRELTTDDYLLLKNIPTSAVPEQDKKLTYSQGILIGAYLGDGSNAFTENNNQIIFSFNKSKWEYLKKYFAQALLDLEVNEKFTESSGKNNVHTIRISSQSVKDFLKDWCTGSKADVKTLNVSCTMQSVEFRRGILNGMYHTDGGNSNRIYSTSKDLIESLEAVCTSLGLPTIIDTSDRREEAVIIRGESYKRNHVLFCLRFYEDSNKNSMAGVYKKKQNSIFFKITNIKEIPNEESVYCFEMKDQNNPYFTLPNGIITHNCRLLSDTEMLEMAGQSNSFGGASAISLGSHRVMTINYNRIALEADKNVEKFREIHKRRTEDAIKILVAHKSLIKRMVDAGLQPFVTMGWIDMKRLFSTIGILGLVECAETMGFDGLDKDNFIKDVLIDLNSWAEELGKKHTQEKGSPITVNIEQIPAESMAHRLPRADKLLFGENKVPYELYSNQFIPLWEDVTLWERMDKDGMFNQLITGGGIVHFNLGERTTATQNRKIIEYAVKSGCEHFALNSVYTVCEKGHTHFGNHTTCLKCGSTELKHFTRVVGFFTEVETWNTKKRVHDFEKRIYRSVTDKQD